MSTNFPTSAGLPHHRDMTDTDGDDAILCGKLKNNKFRGFGSNFRIFGVSIPANGRSSIRLVHFSSVNKRQKTLQIQERLELRGGVGVFSRSVNIPTIFSRRPTGTRLGPWPARGSSGWSGWMGGVGGDKKVKSWKPKNISYIRFAATYSVSSIFILFVFPLTWKIYFEPWYDLCKDFAKLWCFR